MPTNPEKSSSESVNSAKSEKPANKARCMNIVACSKLSSLKAQWKWGKSRICMRIARIEKDKIETSSKCLNLKWGVLKWYQNLIVKLEGPFTR